MKSKPIVALEAVAVDLTQAMEHYESWHADGRRHILEKYEETVSWIAWNPDLFPRKSGPIQRAVLKQSYYVFIISRNRREASSLPCWTAGGSRERSGDLS